MKSFLLALIIPSLVIVAIFHLEQNGFFNVDHIDIVIENSPAQPSFLKSHLQNLDVKLVTFKGQSLWRVDLKKMSKTVTQERWIANSRISRVWPTGLQIKIEPHKIQSVYLDGAGKFYPVISDGSTLDQVEPSVLPDQVILEGNSFAKREMRAKAVKALEEIPNNGSFNRKNISEVRYDTKEGFWMTLIKDGIQVKMGEDQIALKSARVSQVIDYLENKELDARVIDANLSKKVLVRLRKDP